MGGDNLAERFFYRGTMPNWIQERANDIRNAEKEKKAEFDRKAVAASDLKSQLNPFWKELVEVLNQSVREFNLEFSEVNRRIDPFEKPDAYTFMIRRAAYPSVAVKVQLNNAGTTVQYLISKTPKKGMNVVEKQGTFSYTVTDGRVGYSDPSFHSHDDVAKVLLDAFFEF